MRAAIPVSCLGLADLARAPWCQPSTWACMLLLIRCLAQAPNMQGSHLFLSLLRYLQHRRQW